MTYLLEETILGYLTEWDSKDGNPPEAAKRYFYYLIILKKALVKYEARMPRS